MSREFDRYNIEDISIRDLILDDLAGYADIINEIDENMLDRQASIMEYEVFRNCTPPNVIPIIVKRWIALKTVERLLPALETYVAQREIRSDVQREGYVTYYDQLVHLRNYRETLERRLILMRNEVQVELAKCASAGAPQYDPPGMTIVRPFVTEDPFRAGRALFKPQA
jgi:hypothetical protein